MRLLSILLLLALAAAQPYALASRLRVDSAPSPALGRPIQFVVYLPDGYDASAPLPVVYLLHGASGSARAVAPCRTCRAATKSTRAKPSTTAGSGTEDEAPPWKTQVTDEYCKSILSRNASPDMPFSVSLNPYRGCEHGCIYCFARPTHSYLGLSPGWTSKADFRQGQCARPAAARAGQAGYEPNRSRSASTRTLTSPASASASSRARAGGAAGMPAPGRPDHQVLADRARHRHPAPMAAKGQAGVAITLTTLDPADLAHAGAARGRAGAPPAHDPHADRRRHSGRVSVAPIIPVHHRAGHRTDTGGGQGSRRGQRALHRAAPAVGSGPLFHQWLEAHFPERAQRVMNRIREMRGGKDYDSDFGKRMKRRGRVGRPDTPALQQGGQAARHGRLQRPLQQDGRRAVPWNDNAPIYRQLKDRVIGMMLDGILKAGDALPSVRQIAAEYQLNPITVSKAYQELVDDNLVEKRRGIGMYVTKARAKNCSPANASASCAKNGRPCWNASAARPRPSNNCCAHHARGGSA
jgi:DNA-binding transcriptional regulator YhcF (GntR family)